MAELEAQINYDFTLASGALPSVRSTAYGQRFRKSFKLRAVELESWRYQMAKRYADIFISSLILALAFVPGLVIAATIAITSSGPVFYREERIGRGGRKFRIWKFRTMAQSGESKGVGAKMRGQLLRWRLHKNGSDPRVTKVGGFLRRWSLDELPQMLNVILGDMSLIGPRPVVEAELPLYGVLEQYYLAATPGLSGLWQVSGRSNLTFASRAKLDATYVRNWSLLGDLKILFRTVPAVLSRVGAH